MNTRSLSFRLVTWYAGLLTIVFVLLGTATFFLLRHYLEANLLDIQARRARQISDTLLATASRTGESIVAKEVEALYSPEVNDRLIRITSGDGHVVYASGKPIDNSFDPSAVPPPPLTRNGEFVRRERLSSGELLIAARTYTGANVDRYIIEVGVSNARTEVTLRRVLIVLLIGLPTAVCIAVAGGFVLVRRALQPVDLIAHKAEEITQHNLSERLPVAQTGDELERLSVSLNHMISRLEEGILSSKRFLADASHELRTPLSVLRGEVESLAQDGQLKPQTRETLGSMLEDVDRLAQIVEDLLALLRLDADAGKSEWVNFDLAEVATTTADQMSLLAEDKNITVVTEPSPSVIVEGDRARLKQVVVNLLDNAIKYTPSGGVVHLNVGRTDSYAILDVVDNGVGIPPDALPHVFERFFRVDGSRSREQGGAGLGLSIVKAICAAHGAQVEVTSAPGKGTRVRILQPVATDSSSAARVYS